jgi:trehalose 6-phosphate synthase complex regulatory subunit
VDVSLVPTFDTVCVLSRYRNCGDGGEGGAGEGRLLLLDLEGTLWLRDPIKEKDKRVPEEIVKLLVKLVSIPRNRVWVLSGLPIKGALEELTEKVPGLGIV